MTISSRLKSSRTEYGELSPGRSVPRTSGAWLVNSWFRNHIHGRRGGGGGGGQRQPDAERVAPVPQRAPDVSPEPVADPLAGLGPEMPPYINIDKLTDAVLAGTGMFARFDEHDKHIELNSNYKGKVEDINEVFFVTLDRRQSCNNCHIL